jgi:hypothetical protein
MTPNGLPITTIEVPQSKLVTSFSSKSVANSNTPGVIDSSNPVPSAYYRAVAQLSASRHFQYTETNAYSGNNGRTAITAEAGGQQLIYTSGNAGNGRTPQPDGVILGAGAQLIHPSGQPESAQSPGTPTPVGSFNITELGDKLDKIGKDDNFRGLGATSPAASESFRTIRAAGFGEVLRGVSFTPGSR